MPLNKVIATTLLVLISLTVIGQNQSENYILGRINFEGLTKTKEVYLLDILNPQINQPIDSAIIDQKLQILKNLPSVAKAEYTIKEENNKITVTYKIQERTTALPIINFGGIKGNIWFTIGGIENNFRGLGDVLLAYYQNNNGRHSGEIYFRKPRILNSEWGYSFSASKWSSREPVFFDEGTVDYNYDNNGIALGILRNIGLRNRVELTGNYFVESYEKTIDQQLESPPGPQNFSINKFLTKFEFNQNYIDYDYFYLKGIENLLIYQNVLNIEDGSWFNSVQFQSKLFLRPRKKLNIAVRVKLAIASNENSPFAPFVADSNINIRGIGNRIDRGTAQFVLNVEGRYTLYHKNHWSSQAVLFSDSGTWRYPGGKLSDVFNSDRFRQFVGVGIRLNYQRVFGASLRIDYGVDLYDPNHRGVVIGLGQYF